MRIPGKILISLAVIILDLLPLAACAEIQYTPGEMPPAPPAEKLPILSLSMVQDELGFVIIKGTAKNVSSSSSSYAEVKVQFYDAEGTLLNTFTDSTVDLGRGETWDFEILCPGINTDGVKRYEVSATSAW